VTGHHVSLAVNDLRKLCGFEAYVPTDNVSERFGKVALNIVLGRKKKAAGVLRSGFIERFLKENSE
jgi:hypothetical protein